MTAHYFGRLRLWSISNPWKDQQNYDQLPWRRPWPKTMMFIVLEFQSFRVNLVLSRWIILKEVLSRWMKPRWSSALPFEHELSTSEYGPLNQPSQLYLLKYGDFWERPEPATSLPQSFAELKQHKFEWALLWLCRPTNQQTDNQPPNKTNYQQNRRCFLNWPLFKQPTIHPTTSSQAWRH